MEYIDRFKSNDSDKLHFDVIASSSKANTVIIEDMMIDCAAPFRDFEHKLVNIKSLIITHAHKDHLNKANLQRIQNNCNWIMIYMSHETFLNAELESDKNIYLIDVSNEDVNDVNENIFYHTLHLNKLNTKADFIVFQSLAHSKDTRTLALHISINNMYVFYATDVRAITSLKTNIEYDYIFIETNYDEKQYKSLKYARNSKAKYVLSRYDTHLSLQQASAFVAKHCNSNTKVRTLHHSKML